MGSNGVTFKRLFTVREAAVYLGMSPKTLYNQASARQLSVVKMGRSLRFDVRDLDALIDAHKCSSSLDLGVGRRPHGGNV